MCWLVWNERWGSRLCGGFRMSFAFWVGLKVMRGEVLRVDLQGEGREL